MQLELSATEQTLLTGLLEEALGQLKEEIYHTETHEYKEQLKQRETAMMSIISKLKGA
jgi:hypothetical protein